MYNVDFTEDAKKDVIRLKAKAPNAFKKRRTHEKIQYCITALAPVDEASNPS